MPNLEEPENATTSQGQVVLSQAEYQELKQKAGGSPEQWVAPDQKAKQKKNLIGLLFVLSVVAAFAIPGLTLLLFPIVGFGIMAAWGLFRDAKPGQHRNPVIFVFKAMAALALGVIIVLGAFVAFIFVLFSVNPDSAHC